MDSAPTSSTLRVIVTGLIGHHPLGGMTWHYAQYLVGLRRLGHDVYYVEDTGKWPYDPGRGVETEDCGFAVDYVASVMSRFGLADHWAYHGSAPSRWYGLPDAEREEVLGSADLLVNVSGSLGSPEAYRRVPRMAYVDTDPVFTQIGIAGGRPGMRERADVHDVHFSFGERLEHTDLPLAHRWRPTRQPIVLDAWNPAAPRRGVFTTVMNWRARTRPAMHAGRCYGQKDAELVRFLGLPRRVAPVELELASNSGRGREAPLDLLRSHGWRVVDPEAVCLDLDSYHDYIESSAAEWSVAKHGYVEGRAGWFSERSACYLAAGRPVVVQETGCSAVLPVGEGLLTFRTPDEAVDAIKEVAGDHARHGQAARAIAEDCFGSDFVLTRLVEDAFASERAVPQIETPVIARAAHV